MEEKIKDLSEYIILLKEKKGLGFNELSKESGINPRSLNELVYGKAKRINPVFLIQLAGALGVHYKEFYKILGYLAEGDDIVREKTITNENNSIENNSIFIGGDVSNVEKIGNETINNYNQNADDIIDLSKLSTEAATSIRTLYNTLLGK